jgi:D-xylose transport system permease protein
MVIALLAIWGFFAAMSPAYLSARNLSHLSVELAINAVLALGMFLVILPGQVDLAAGSGVGLFGGIAAVLIFNYLQPAPLAMIIAAALAVVLWALMGAIIIIEGIPAFIITLAGLRIFQGLHWLVIQNGTIPVEIPNQPNIYAMLTTWYLPPVFGWILAALVVIALVRAELVKRKRRAAHALEIDPGEITYSKLFVAAQLIILLVIVANQFHGIPLPVLILGVVAFSIHMLTQHTRLGRHLYAIGGNQEAAAISGIPVAKTVIIAFAIAGLIVAVTGFMQTAYIAHSTTTVGEYMELDAVAACVIGGASLRGGKGNVVGVLFGALIMASLLNGMILMAVAIEKQLIARGAVLALAVWMDVRMGRATTKS